MPIPNLRRLGAVGLAIAAGVLGVPGAAAAATYVVSSGGDSGSGTLRDAIAAVDGGSGHGDTIRFNPGVTSISLNPPALPVITAPVTIDGPSAGGLVSLDGHGAGTATGLVFGAGSAGSVLNGVYIHGFSGAGIEVGSSDVTIGDGGGGDGDVVSGNGGDGILVDAGVDRTGIENALIGVTPTGAPQGNGGDGIHLLGTDASVAATSGATAAISNNSRYGLEVASSDDHAGNHISGYALTGNGLGPFAISGPALSPIAIASTDGSTVTVVVHGATAGLQLMAEAGRDAGCAGAYVPFAGNTAYATADGNGSATLTIPVRPAIAAGSGVRVLVTDPAQGTQDVPHCVGLPAPPSAVITAPGGNGFYAIDQPVATAFACTEGSGGPGIATCTDSAGGASPGRLDTSHLGPHIYGVTAVSQDGLRGSASLSYTVAAAPRAAIRLPAAGARYLSGQQVRAQYTCTEGPDGPGIGACTGSAQRGRPIDTRRPGVHRFTVTALSRDGQLVRRTVTYRVIASGFRLTRLVARRNGDLVLTVAVPGPGRLSVVETGRRAGAAGVIRRLTGSAFLFARGVVRAPRRATLRLTVVPGVHGQALVAHHASPLVVGLSLTFAAPHRPLLVIGRAAVTIPV